MDSERLLRGLSRKTGELDTRERASEREKSLEEGRKLREQSGTIYYRS
jgi:hypothetical protein